MKRLELKKQLKEYAANIKVASVFYKECQRGNKTWEEYYALCSGHKRFPTSYRHMHIAYCLLRGRKYEQIESKVKDGNEPKWDTVNAIVEQYREVEGEHVA